MGSLSDWGLPSAVVQAYSKKGVRNLYPWQAAALQEGICGHNLLFCAPTSGGKSLVAEVLLINRLMAPCQTPRQRRSLPVAPPRCLFVLPFVSIVIEKSGHLKNILNPVGLQVQGYFGDDRTAVLKPQGESVAVCTMEKANVAVNKLMEEGRLGEISCVIVDEAHMLGDERRGSALELMLTKILYSVTNCQIVAMSATMSGLETMRSWLKARLFVTNYRPVPLDQHVVRDGKIYKLKTGEKAGSRSNPSAPDESFQQIRQLAQSHDRDRDRLVPLVAEAVSRKESVLVFCQSRKQCENCARMLCEFLPGACHLHEVAETKEHEKRKPAVQRENLVRRLQDSMVGYPNPLLEKLVQNGVGYHHAGMTKQERNCVEDGFRGGALSVITATTTLAAGVNLPAHRVILRSLKQGISELDRGQYLQMVGRAGRAGQASRGESFIIARADGSDSMKIRRLLMAPLPCLTSRLLPDSVRLNGKIDRIDDIVISNDDSRQIQRILLEGIACGSVACPEDVRRLITSTFVCHQAPFAVVAKFTVTALRSLQTSELIRWRQNPTPPDDNISPLRNGKWEPMPRGKAIYASSLAMSDALRLYDSLKMARSHLVLDDICHAIFVVMLHFPFESICDWVWWQDVLKGMSPSRRRIAEVVGVRLKDIEMYMVYPVKKATQLSHARFAAACAIADVIQGGDIYGVVEKWGRRETATESGISAGQFQNLQGDVAKWASMAALMCQATDWWALEEVMNRLAEQAIVGSPPELMDLMRIKEPMSVPRARALFKKGITCARALAAAPVEDIEKILASCIPKKKKKQSEAKQSIQIGLTGNAGQNAVIRRAAVSILNGARDLLLNEAKEAEEAASRVLRCVSVEACKSIASEAARSTQLGTPGFKRRRFSFHSA
ncbi:hypothetical protein BSKO_09940 [Bryopsis sp. KO-2023]|nr:hypothetical protein BSKO_09940 [Bryopsis sp. KO-2023]